MLTATTREEANSLLRSAHLPAPIREIADNVEGNPVVANSLRRIAFDIEKAAAFYNRHGIFPSTSFLLLYKNEFLRVFAGQLGGEAGQGLMDLSRDMSEKIEAAFRWAGEGIDVATITPPFRVVEVELLRDIHQATNSKVTIERFHPKGKVVLAKSWGPSGNADLLEGNESFFSRAKEGVDFRPLAA